MANTEEPRSLQRYWLGVLLLIVVAWIIYSLIGGPTPPEPGTGPPLDQTERPS